MATPAQIDKEANKQSIFLPNLRVQNNSLLPIFRLPPEALAHIFTQGACDYYREENYWHTFKVPGWVNVSYVCRHWRDVALDCPTLWTYHFIVSLRWTEALLARSKHALLNIRIAFDPRRPISWWSSLAEKLLSHVERTQELLLHVPARVLPPNLSFYAPHLRILDIDGTWSASDWPSTIKDMDVPPLRTLKLSDCPLPWYSFNLSNVTTLFLSHAPDPKQNIMDFLAMLSRIRALTALRILESLRSPRGSPSDGVYNVSSKIGLPSLTRLVIRETLSTTVTFLSCVNIPLQAQVWLEFQWESNSSVDDYAQISSIIAQRSSHSSSFSPTIRSLAIRFPRSDEPTFSCALSEHGDCDSDLSVTYLPREDHNDCHDSLIVRVRLGRSMASSDRDRVANDICDAIPMTHVESLHVLCPPLSPDFWRKTLSDVRGLRCLKLSDGRMPNLVPFLARAADEPASGTTGDHDPTSDHTFVPVLEELVLECIKFAHEDDVARDTISKTSLRDAWSTRKAPHPGLSMFDCVETSRMKITVYPFVSEEFSDEYY